MEITVTIEPHERAAWRLWLEQNHEQATEIWLIYQQRSEGGITYLDIVEEALCFGWVDGLAKKYDANRTAQRLTPRWARSNWTELNKERVRRLIREGLMTPAGRTRKNEMFGNWDDTGPARTATRTS
jgi:uncharacterized protein YdeI (YjbR/CyaY-like superfamily)